MPAFGWGFSRSDYGFHVIVEGILCASHYGGMLTALREGHQGTTGLYYLHVPFEETLRRHATKPQAAEYGEAEMSAWYRELDLLPGGVEHVVSRKRPSTTQSSSSWSTLDS
jgi:hypothetical protein